MESKGKIKSSGKHFTQRDKKIFENLLINYYNIIKNKKQIILIRKLRTRRGMKFSNSNGISEIVRRCERL